MFLTVKAIYADSKNFLETSFKLYASLGKQHAAYAREKAETDFKL